MGKVFSIVEARATMVSINLERDWIEDPEYNEVDHVEKQDTDVINMKQELLKMFILVIWSLSSKK